MNVAYSNYRFGAAVCLLILGSGAKADALRPQPGQFRSTSAEATVQMTGSAASELSYAGRREWREDLDALDERIRHAHVNPFWLRSEAGYAALLNQARAYLRSSARVDPLRVHAYFEQLVAYLGDGHAYVRDKAGRFGQYPYRVAWFGDGLFITATSADRRQLLGAEVVAIDGMPMVRVKALLAPFLPIVNASSFKLQSRDALAMAGLLHAAGISRHAGHVTLTVRAHGATTLAQALFRRDPSPGKLVELAELKGNAVPLYRQGRATDQWHELIDGALYVRYASAVEKQPGDIVKFSDGIADVIADVMNDAMADPGASPRRSGAVRKVIVDVRDNAGGDSYHNAALIEVLRRWSGLNRRGSLIVLTNHNTFSAAVNFVASMEVLTHAVFIGEAAGDRPHFAGESGPQALYRLPHSRTGVSLSFSEWNAGHDHDRRDSTPLNVAVHTGVADILAGRDPVLQAALAYIGTAPDSSVFDEAASARWIGRYDYSADKALTIAARGGGLHMEVTESVFAQLHPAPDGSAATSLAGVRLRLLPNGGIGLRQHGNAERILARLPAGQLKPLELLMAGRFADASIAYRMIHAAAPTSLALRANSLGLLASQLRARYRRQDLYCQLRSIAMQLHGPNLLSWDDDGSSGSDTTQLHKGAVHEE